MYTADGEIQNARWLEARVRAISTPAADVRALELEVAGGATDYPPGSHIEVEVNIDGKRASRSYSLVGHAPKAGAWVIAVKRTPITRGGSRFMWTLRPGDLLRVSEPKSHFELTLGATEYLLLAGGIGITPLLGMAECLDRSGARFCLLYAGRSRVEMAYLPVLQQLLGDRLRVAVSDEGARFDLQQEIARLHPAAELYVCGPIGLMDAARYAWDEAGRPAASCRLETFGSSGHLVAQPFVTRVRDLNLQVVVSREESLFDALVAQGVAMAGHCRRGECGLCVVDVVDYDGELDHRDVFLSRTEKSHGRSLCACVSRVTGSVTIDTGYRDLRP